MTVSEALPVVLELSGPIAGRVRRHLEGELGWQPVETEGPVPARVRIVDVPASPTAGPGPLPTWLVVTDQDEADVAARAATRIGAVEVVRWPPPEGAFVAAAAGLRQELRPVELPELRVGGASGGVGCTTVALALGGLGAWAGEPTTVVTHGASPHPAAPSIDPETLSSPDVGRAACAVRGVPGLELLHVTSPAPDVPVQLAGRSVVRDLGVTHRIVDVLVVRRDAAGLAAAGATAAGTVLVSDVGIVPARAFRDAVGGRRVALLPWSVRVARAALLGRVPASLPGRWLRELATAVGRHRPQPRTSRS